MKVLEIKDYSFWYPDGTRALTKINLSMEAGEFLTIMGRNGAGKTTLCLSVVGIIPNIFPGKIEGTIRVMGKNPSEHYVYEITKDVGIVLQDPESQLFTHTVLSEVTFAAENLGLPKEEILKRADWALKVTELDGLEERSPRSLSGGQKQRLAIAAALVTKPKMLILDEPTSQLDPVGTKEVLYILKKLKDEGITILITEHKTDEIIEISDRIVILGNGSIIKEGRPEEILSDIDLLREMKLKPPEIGEFFYELRRKGIPLNNIPLTLSQGENALRALINKEIITPMKYSNIYHSSKGIGENNIVIDVENISFTYRTSSPPVKALDDISFKIKKGEFVGIIGKNGSGKTTLMKVLVGLLKPDSGKVIIDGENIFKLSSAERAKKIGLVLQNPDTQLFRLSVAEEIEFGLRNIGLSSEEIIRRRREVLELVGLAGYEKVNPFQLSFGDRKKLAVASIIAMEPKIVVLDEPTTGQDYAGRREICDIAMKLNKRGITVLMVTHDMDLVARYTNRVLIMNAGRVLFDGPTRVAFTKVGILKEAGLIPPKINLLAQSVSDLGFRFDIMSMEELLENIQVKGETKCQS